MKKIRLFFCLLVFCFIWTYQTAAYAEELFGKNQQFMVEQGDKAYAQQLYDGAMGNWQKALDIDPKGKNNDLLYVRIGITHFEQGQDKEAKSIFEKALLRNSSNVDAYYYLGELAKKDKDWGSVEKIYQKMIALKPTEEFYFTCGLSQVYQGRKAEARSSFAQVVQLNPANSGALFNLGALYYDQEAYPEALAYWQKSYQLDVKNPEQSYHVALVYYRLGQKKEAKAYCQKALKLDPNHSKTKKLQVILEK